MSELYDCYCDFPGCEAGSETGGESALPERWGQITIRAYRVEAVDVDLCPDHLRLVVQLLLGGAADREELESESALVCGMSVVRPDAAYGGGNGSGDDRRPRNPHVVPYRESRAPGKGRRREDALLTGDLDLLVVEDADDPEMLGGLWSAGDAVGRRGPTPAAASAVRAYAEAAVSPDDVGNEWGWDELEAD